MYFHVANFSAIFFCNNYHQNNLFQSIVQTNACIIFFLFCLDLFGLTYYFQPKIESSHQTHPTQKHTLKSHKNYFHLQKIHTTNTRIKTQNFIILSQMCNSFILFSQLFFQIINFFF